MKTVNRPGLEDRESESNQESYERSIFPEGKCDDKTTHCVGVLIPRDERESIATERRRVAAMPQTLERSNVAIKRSFYAAMSSGYAANPAAQRCSNKA